MFENLYQLVISVSIIFFSMSTKGKFYQTRERERERERETETETEIDRKTDR